MSIAGELRTHQEGSGINCIKRNNEAQRRAIKYEKGLDLIDFN